MRREGERAVSEPMYPMRHAKGDTSDQDLRDPKRPGEIPILIRCSNCGQDISAECESFIFVMNEIAPSPPTFNKGGVLQPGGARLQRTEQLVTAQPHRCPHCKWPIWWGKQKEE